MVEYSTMPCDVFLLFDTLPYEFDEELPLTTGPNVYLEDTPIGVLDAVNPPSEADFVLPGYHLGLGANCCLRTPVVEIQQPGLGSTDLLFLSVSALRLRKPIVIKIAGGFELGSEENLLKNTMLYNISSSYQPYSNERYSGEDIFLSKKISERLMYIVESNYSRIISAYVLFSQVTIGFSKSFQMAYLALFSALEALFIPHNGNKATKATSLAQRTANFLSNFDFPESLYDWLKNEYNQGRNKLAHGIQDISPWTGLREGKKGSFGRLHEITRLCILGFLSLDDMELESLSRLKRTQLQQKLDNLSPATGRFLEGQRMWF